MVKRIVFFLVCFLFLLGGGVFAQEETQLIPNDDLEVKVNSVEAEAVDDTIETQGSSYVEGDFTYWFNDDGTVTVTDYNGSSRDVVVPATCKGIPVTKIGGYMFSDRSDVDSVVLPKGIIELEQGVFARSSIKRVVLNDGIQVLGASVFKSTPLLSDLNFPDTIDVVETACFSKSAFDPAPYVKGWNYFEMNDVYYRSKTVTVDVEKSYVLASEIAVLVNKERASRGLYELKLTNSLVEAAMLRAAECDFHYSHYRPNGTLFDTVMEGVGGENLASGTAYAEYVFNSWMESPLHRAAILTEGNYFMGIGASKNLTEGNGWVNYTMLFSEKNYDGSPIWDHSGGVQKGLFDIEYNEYGAGLKFNVGGIPTELSVNAYSDPISFSAVASKNVNSEYTLVSNISSSNPDVLQVVGNKLKGIKPGVATIEIKSGSTIVTKEVKVTGKEIPLESLSINKTSTTIQKGKTEKLLVTKNPTNTTDDKDIIWESSNMGVATVDSNGTVSAISPGVTKVTATCSGKSVSCDVTVPEISLVIKTMPSKVNYVEGQELDLTGGVLTYSPKEGNETDVAMTAPNVSVTGYNKNPSTYGTQTLTASYRDKKVNFDVNVAKKEIAKIEVTNVPSPKPVESGKTQVNYIAGQNWGILSDGVLKLTYNNNETGNIPITADMIPVAPIIENPGPATVNVSYAGLKTTYGITVEPKVITGVRVDPSSVNVKVNGAFKLSDIIVYSDYNNGKSDEGVVLEESMLDRDIDLSKPGKFTYTVTPVAASPSLKAEFTMNVQDKELIGVTLKTAPTPNSFVVGTEFSSTGGKLTLAYDNNTNEDIDVSSAWVTGPDMSKVGSAKAVVKYDKYTVDYPVSIVEASVSSIAVLNAPKTSYIEGQDLDVTGGKLKVTMNNGTEKVVEMTSAMCKGFDSSKPATDQVITVTYEGKTTTYKVNFVAKKLIALDFESQPQKEYFVGSKVDFSIGAFKGTYDNGKTEVIPFLGSKVVAEGFDSSKAGTGKVTYKYNGFSLEFDVVYLTHERVDAFIASVNAINIDGLTINDKGNIENLKADYAKLTELEKMQVKPDTIKKFNNAVDKMNMLIEEANKQKDPANKEGTVGNITETTSNGGNGNVATGLEGSYVGTFAVCLGLVGLCAVFIAGRKARK